MRAFRSLIEEESGEAGDAMPAEGPQSYQQVWNIFDRHRGVRRRVVPWQTLKSGPVSPMQNDPRLSRQPQQQRGDKEVSF